MRLLLVSFFACVCIAAARNNVKSLTESQGQEVIEIGSPIKDLPGDIEEEPSAEIDDINDLTTIKVPLPTASKKKYPATYSETHRRMKDIDKIDGGKDDEEVKIEKELADLYKDNADYKMDSGEATTWPSTKWISTAWPDTTFTYNSPADKPIERQRPGEFSFQPRSDSKKDIEAFRTSIDEISCQKNQKLDDDLFTASTSYPKTTQQAKDGSGARETFSKSIFLIIVLCATALYN